MKNQFFYEHSVVVPPKADAPEGTKSTTVIMRNSLNMDLVLRTHQNEAGNTVVVLDDLHERTEEVPNVAPNGKVTGMKKNLVTYQSEIPLNKKDTERFYKLTNIENV